jgi:hypothetical protein
MAARLSPKHDDLTRSKIQTSQLINRLQNHVNGKAELSSTQVKAAQILLAKTLPDLTATKHSGEIRTPLIQNIPR